MEGVELEFARTNAAIARKALNEKGARGLRTIWNHCCSIPCMNYRQWKMSEGCCRCIGDYLRPALHHLLEPAPAARAASAIKARCVRMKRAAYRPFSL